MSLLLAVAIGFPASAALRAQTEAPAAPSAAQSSDNVKPGSQAANNEEEFRHGPMVKMMARTLHMSTEEAAQTFEDVNSAVLVLAILFFIFKFLPKAIRDRTATIQKQLIDARSATEIADERLTAVEAKLARLGQDIDAVRQQTERDILEDEKRIKRSLEEEKERIVKSAEQEIESAGAAAQRELKRFAAELSIDRAASRIQMTVDADRTLVERFGKDLAGRFDKGRRN